MDLNQLRVFFYYCTAINIGLLFLSAIVFSIPAWRKFAGKLHSKWYGIKEADFAPMIYRFLAYYKLLIIVFNLIPCIVLQYFV